jgi:hypothetical protein
MSAPSNDDDIRTSIIRDVISRAGVHKSGPVEGRNLDQVPGQVPPRNRKKVDQTTTGGCVTE